MDIQEAFDVYLAGEEVEDPHRTAPDLEYVMYPEEEDYVWRMVTLPLDALGCDLSLAPNDGCEEDDEAQRFARIRAWMQAKGVVEALAESPPIARMTTEFGLDMVDGRHRLALAHEAGLTEVRLMLGAAPGWQPPRPSGP